MKSSHTLSCPIHALAAAYKMQEAPRDWRILRTLTASRSVAQVWNPKTGRVSPQYHVVFDNDFSTVPFMVAGTAPPHWGDLVDTHHTSPPPRCQPGRHMVKWQHPDMGKQDQLPDPFTVVTDHRNRLKRQIESMGNLQLLRPKTLLLRLSMENKLL